MADPFWLDEPEFGALRMAALLGAGKGSVHAKVYCP